MDFSLTESQQEIARLAGQLLDDGKADPWKELARAGLLALSLPPELGGDGLGVLDTAVLLDRGGPARGSGCRRWPRFALGVLPVVRCAPADVQHDLLGAALRVALDDPAAAIREPSEPMVPSWPRP